MAREDGALLCEHIKPTADAPGKIIKRLSLRSAGINYLVTLSDTMAAGKTHNPENE